MNIQYQFMRMKKFLKQKFFQSYDNDDLALTGGIPVCERALDTVPYKYTEIDADNISRVVLSGKLSHEQGSEIINFEREFAGLMGTQYALSTNSGTSALHLAVQSIGLQPGDEIIVPAYTFIACAQAVLSNTGIPVFADIDDTFTISPTSIKKVITKKTRAIIVVHIFGNVANMREILEIAQKHNLAIIEDCAQAIGARYAGKNVGSIGDIGCFSFNSKKAIPTGQGGMIVTNRAELFRRFRSSRNTGIEVKDGIVDVISFGGTFYMTELEATLARSVLRQLESLNSIRRKNYEYLIQLLFPLRSVIEPYRVLLNGAPSYSRLAFMIDLKNFGISRNKLIDALNAEGVPMKTFYPIPLYNYSLFQKRRSLFTGDGYPFTTNRKINYKELHLPFVEDFCRRQIGMEFSPYWGFQDMRNIAKSIDKVVRILSNTQTI